MSSRSSVDKVEPIKLETTILKIDIKTNGDLTTKEFDLIPFHPNMSDVKDLSNNNYILFPSFVKITMDYLKNAGVGQDYRKVFMDLDKYIKLIKFITQEVVEKKNFEEDFTLLVDQTQFKNYAMSFVQDFTADITNDFRSVQKYERLTDAEIISNNIGIIKSIFLPVKGRFFVLGHEYIISESKYIPPYKASEVMNEKLAERKKNVPLNFTITVELQLLDVIKNPGMGDFSRLSCQQKKISLKKDVKEIFGDSYGYKEDVKVVLPPLTPTTTSKRGFGKLQLEWEERNKYVKAPTTEAERLAIENKWSPLQKKLSQYDKYQDEFNKVPPLWIKERKELDDKYAVLEKELKGYSEEIERIKGMNKDYDPVKKTPSFVYDLINAVETKMINDIGEFLRDRTDVITKANDIVISKKDTPNENLKSLIAQYKENKTDELLAQQIVQLNDALDIITNKSFGKTNNLFSYELDNKKIDAKYTEPFLKVMKDKAKDVDELKKENDRINVQLTNLKEKGDTYATSAKEEERKKIQAALLKKQTDYKVLEDKYGANGEKLVKTWESVLNKIQGLKKNIESDKEVGEKKILNDSVQTELTAKLKEIKVLKEKLYKANFFEGKYGEITKDEIESFSKKPGDRPIEDVTLLESNIKSLQDEYLDIANKLGIANKIQGWITLLNDDLSRIKNLKEKKEKEKKDKDAEINKINSALQVIADTKRRNGTSSESPEITAQRKKIEELKKEIKEKEKANDDEEEIKKLKEKLAAEEKKLAESNPDDDKDVKLKKEERKNLQEKYEIINTAFELIKKHEKDYNTEITRLKQLKEKDKTNEAITDSTETINANNKEFKEKINNASANVNSGGSSNKLTQKKSRRKYRYRRHKKTKRAKKNKKHQYKKSLKKRRHPRQKKKYTKR